MGRLKVLAFCHFDVCSQCGGGKAVVYSFLKELSQYFEVLLLSLVPYGGQPAELLLSRRFVNVLIPQNFTQARKMWQLERELGEGLFDVVQCLYLDDNIEFLARVEQELKNSDVIIFEHPYLVGVIELFPQEFQEKFILYHSHNNEYKLKLPLLKSKPDLQERVKAFEKAALEKADVVLIASSEEGQELLHQYGCFEKKERFYLFPHSLDLKKIRPIDRSTVKERKSRIGLSNKVTVTFVGSWHPPNLEALEFLIDIAQEDQSIEYFVVGSVKDYFSAKYPNKPLPSNLHLLGVVNEVEKEYIYACTDVAVNPMFSGAGTNVKMIEYMAYGLPIVTTSFGARGIPGQFLVIEGKDKRSFIAGIHELACDKNKALAMVESNRKIVASQFDYGENVKKLLRFLLGYPYGSKVEKLRYLYDCLLLDSLAEDLARMGVESQDSFLTYSCAEILASLLRA